MPRDRQLGVSPFPSDAKDADTLIKNADAAMYAAKEEGHNTSASTLTRSRRQSIERLMLETGCAGARAQRIVLHYQPKRSLQSGEHLRRRGSGSLAAS